MKKIDKPWGYEELIEINSSYMFKRLKMKKGHRCSLQYHKKKKETIFVISGKLRVYMGSREDALESKIFKPGDTVTIPPGLIHRMEGIEDTIYLESSTPEIDDVIRIIDDYKRI